MEQAALLEKNDTPRYQSRGVGETALWGAGVFTKELGVNDPLTHLEQYFQNGEAAISSIDEDVITDSAERLVKPKFINRVVFDRTGRDFVSRKNHFSMRSMTRTSEYKFANVTDIQLYRRARIESKEVDRLNDWFDTAQINDVYIVPSMPMTRTETYTVVRIHQKVGDSELAEHVLTLHNSTIELFNELHARIGADVRESADEFELLDSMFAYRPKDGDFEGFLEGYISTYDTILAERNPGKIFRHGLEGSERADQPDDITMIRGQGPLRQIYLDSLRALGNSSGYVTPEIADIDRKLGFGMGLRTGDVVSSVAARGLLDNSLQYIVATLNRASQETLEQLASGNGVSESASHYGGQASAEGVRYEGACPSGSGGAAATEASALGHAHRKNIDPGQCGTCPNCDKEYFVPDEIYKKKTVHCGNCNATIGFGGRGPDYDAIRQYYQSHPRELGFFATLTAVFRKNLLESKLKDTIKKRELADNELEHKRLGKQLQEQQSELGALRQAV